SPSASPPPPASPPSSDVDSPSVSPSLLSSEPPPHAARTRAVAAEAATSPVMRRIFMFLLRVVALLRRWDQPSNPRGARVAQHRLTRTVTLAAQVRVNFRRAGGAFVTGL